jgi:hypothetical protein
MNRLTIAMGVGLVLSGCAMEATDEAGVLEVDATEASIQGTYSQGDATLRFRSIELEPQVFDIVVEVNGMTLAAIVDQGRRVAEVDGFAANGGDTQMRDADRAILGGFVAAVGTHLDVEAHGAATMLHRVASNWSQTPDSAPLQRTVAGSEDRAYVSLCGYYKQWVVATHDCQVCNNFDPKCTSTAMVGYRWDLKTHYYINGSWTTTVPDHVANLYEAGDCFGNCGPGCPSGDQTLTLDCHDHDHCVRNGHFIASMYCNDEFIRASDDEFFAPRCAGTSRD